MRWLIINKKLKIIEILYILFVTIFFIVFLLLSGEMIFRVKYHGFKKAIKSFFVKRTQPSVLGTNNWVISDPYLDYRLNPAIPEINEFSMREKEIQVPKPLGLKRIIILGDSIPYAGNPSFVDLLKKEFQDTPNLEILNAGTPGYTTYQELVFLEKILLKTDPDFIILAYCLNDNYTFLHRFDEKAEMLWTPEAKESLMIHNSIDKFISKSYFLTTLKIVFSQKTNKKQSKYSWKNSIDFNTAWEDSSWPNFGKYLKKMNNILKKNNSKLYVVIFPLEMQFNNDLLKNDYQLVLKPQQKVSFYCNKYKIPCLDLFPVFQKHINQEGMKLFTDGVHLSTDGHKLTSQAIYKFLNSNDIF